MVSTTQRERSDWCGVPNPTHDTVSERLIITRLEPTATKIIYEICEQTTTSLQNKICERIISRRSAAQPL